jgi:FkbM family methyltransferase
LIDRISQHAFLSRPLSSSSTVIDLGGNQGEFCIPVAEKYGCRVVVVEPVPELASKLAGRSPRITVLPVAAGAVDGVTSFNYDLARDKTGSAMDLEIVGSELPQESRRTIQVRVLSLESIVKKANAEVIDLLKVDIEGLELDMLLAADASLLRRCKQITVEFHDYWYPQLRSRTEETKTRLRQLGFHMIRFTPNNKDVLFINEQLLPMSFAQRVYVGGILRNWYGFGRFLRLCWRNAMGRLLPA